MRPFSHSFLLGSLFLLKKEINVLMEQLKKNKLKDPFEDTLGQS